MISAGLLALAAFVGPAAAQAQFPTSTYIVPGQFPTSLFASYYNDPTATSAQVQPVVTDPVTNTVYPQWLTDPDHIPTNDTADPHPLPPALGSSALVAQALQQIQSIAANTAGFGNNTCAQCQASLAVAKLVALAAPDALADLAVQTCQAFDYSSETLCEEKYMRNSAGWVLAQTVYWADVGGYDGQLLCYEFLGLCPQPPTLPLNMTSWFAKPKPDPLPAPKQATGERMKVLHISDFHIDPRYATGAETNCTSGGLCCRSDEYNKNSPHETLSPAPRFGSYNCDAPFALVAASLEAIPPLTGTQETGFNFTLFTGDMLAHDPQWEQSEALNEYAEVVLFDMFKQMLGPGAVYVALGNHDSYNQDLAAPLSLGDGEGQEFSWLYDHVAALWQYEGWMNASEAAYAKAHYAAFMVQRGDGLRIVSLNTNLWYKNGYLNYINSTDPDPSGMLRFLTDELQDAEDAGDRVWIMGHVLSGWDGSNPLMNPTNLFYQIVDRFSPHVIANIVWGHTHEDEMMIYYTNNATVQSADTAINTGWIGPSVTPLTNLNSGFRVYEVDSGTFEVVDAYTWRSSVNDYPALDNQTEVGPTYEFEYSTRDAYGTNITWGANDPLNGTWWHLVTEEFEKYPELVQQFTTYQGKGSPLSPNCTNAECAEAKICYMRSGSASIGQQNCIQGYGSVQSAYGS
ncbi:Metallo-dependent phosphatase [Coniophora puteana RWD-64-598 SS2]|uniref:Sphingomyelin phosphodiesterase n=1 Tax=Coniophora puteana (strain RWD-64-598) TaxID=741705 RepID=A0A5M3MU49_CONPW|nr:Metallo-dependent phosphatase [Coniophora puteana RWD-64-598 SS2]EIW82649.1 Metallo-dependent phosphatase [Coniophora puteana RWD-64-598 SS2]